ALRAVAVARVGVRAGDERDDSRRRLAVVAAQLLALGEEAVLQPREAELIPVAGAVHDLEPVELAADHGVLVRVRVPADSGRPLVAGGRPEGEGFERPGRGVVRRTRDVADDHVGAGRPLARRLRA